MPRQAAPWPQRRRRASHHARRCGRRAPGGGGLGVGLGTWPTVAVGLISTARRWCWRAHSGVAAGAEWRTPRECAESSPPRQASARLVLGQSQARAKVWRRPPVCSSTAARPRHLAAARALAPGVPAQLGEAAARVRGCGELRQVHLRARASCLRPPSACQHQHRRSTESQVSCRGAARTPRPRSGWRRRRCRWSDRRVIRGSYQLECRRWGGPRASR